MFGIINMTHVNDTDNIDQCLTDFADQIRALHDACTLAYGMCTGENWSDTATGTRPDSMLHDVGTPASVSVDK